MAKNQRLNIAARTLSVATLYFCAILAGVFTLCVLGGMIAAEIEMPGNLPLGFHFATMATLIYAATAIALIWKAAGGVVPVLLMPIDLKRRRFRFSLRTLFVVITGLGILSCWLGWNFQQVRQREAVINLMTLRGALPGVAPRGPEASSMPLGWRLVGAQKLTLGAGPKPLNANAIVLPPGEFTNEEIARFRQCFPEIPLIDYFLK